MTFRVMQIMLLSPLCVMNRRLVLMRCAEACCDGMRCKILCGLSQWLNWTDGGTVRGLCISSHHQAKRLVTHFGELRWSSDTTFPVLISHDVSFKYNLLSFCLFYPEDLLPKVLDRCSDYETHPHNALASLRIVLNMFSYVIDTCLELNCSCYFWRLFIVVLWWCSCLLS